MIMLSYAVSHTVVALVIGLLWINVHIEIDTVHQVFKLVTTIGSPKNWASKLYEEKNVGNEWNSLLSDSCVIFTLISQMIRRRAVRISLKACRSRRPELCKPGYQSTNGSAEDSNTFRRPGGNQRETLIALDMLHFRGLQRSSRSERGALSKKEPSNRTYNLE